MKKILAIAVCMVFVLAGALSADASTFEMGGTWTSLSGYVNGTLKDVGSGSIDVSKLDGQALPWVYCVDLFKTIDPAYNPYNATVVTTDGTIYGVALPNASKVAWLLDHYAVGGQDDNARALQAAIWNVIYGDNVFHANPSASYSGKYDAMLLALDGNTGNVADFLWISPKKENSDYYQGLVSRVPEPGTLLLLGAGLLGLAGLRRKE